MHCMKAEAAITYPTSLYPVSVLRQAIQAYRPICTIRLEVCGDHTDCFFSDSCYDLDTTMGEFSNYLIELLNGPRHQ